MISRKKIRYFFETALVRLLAWWIPHLTRKSCVHLANGLGTVAFKLDRRGRAVALDNLRCAFGASLTDEQRRAIMHQSYRNFARTMVDLFWSPALARPENRHFLRVHGWEALNERAARERRGIIYVSLHAANWEWSSLSCSFGGPGAVAVAEHFKNAGLEAVFKSLREVTGQMIIPQENSMLKMLRAVKRGGRAAFLADLSVPPTQAATIVTAFGLEMSASILHAVLAQRADALVACVDTYSNRDGSCDARVSVLEYPAGATLREIAQACWDHFEPGLRREPGLWLWAYKHFRYKPAGATTEYPFYANEWDAFDALRAESSRTGG
jgi:KDO2-lipid IV(A) lauroyltransferase